MEYAYRYSKLKGKREHYLVLSTLLQLVPAYEPAELNATANSFIEHRKKTQPPGASLGSMFKNPPGDYAGRLIEEAGLKGYQIGEVCVSPVHANFFINVGNATAADYSALIDFTRETVLEKTDVELELEIEKVGEGFD
jgi:UDP-N-acetylmuramate dehydrogenase